ncbi:hypothetical protein HMPREF0578_1363 [Mobiluncus mulieris 28-1]|nr:hypothetical protein HMPREF0578_1363 [Mobiluncus mulieris 28-1]
MPCRATCANLAGGVPGGVPTCANRLPQARQAVSLRIHEVPAHSIGGVL